MRTDYKASLSFAGIAGAVLLCGLLYYLALRTALPAPLERLHLRPLTLAGSVEGSALLWSLPSLIHVTAFGFSTCALFRPRVLSALVAGAAWAGIDVLWELSCANDRAWLRLGGELMGVGSVPACTYDSADIVASVAGAAAVTCIAWIVLKVHSVPSSTAQERQNDGLDGSHRPWSLRRCRAWNLLIIASSPGPKPGDPPPAAPTRSRSGYRTTLRESIQRRTAGRTCNGDGAAELLVLPLLTTTAPIVRAILDSPSNSTLVVRATDESRSQSATLPMVPSSSPGPTTGYYQVLNATSGWYIAIRYPNSFQGSKLITTKISDVVGGVESAPVSFSMSFRGSTVTVSIVTENGDGRVTSNPPGIDCPGVCTFDFLTATSVSLGQSVLRNQTEFTGAGRAVASATRARCSCWPRGRPSSR